MMPLGLWIFVVLLQLYRLFDFSLPSKSKVEVTINKVIYIYKRKKKDSI